jgi:hypothetical protein
MIVICVVASPLPDLPPGAESVDVARPLVGIQAVGLEYRIVGLTSEFLGARLESCCDLILAGEPVEDRPTANVVANEVDQVWWLGVGLGRCELRERSVWPRLVEMVQVRGEDLP